MQRSTTTPDDHIASLSNGVREDVAFRVGGEPERVEVDGPDG